MVAAVPLTAGAGFLGLARVAVDTVAARTPPHGAEAPPSLRVVGSIAGVAAALAGRTARRGRLPAGIGVGDALLGALA